MDLGVGAQFALHKIAQVVLHCSGIRDRVDQDTRFLCADAGLCACSRGALRRTALLQCVRKAGQKARKHVCRHGKHLRAGK
eukprot:662908-Prymnesium_polylepis.1